MKRTRNRRVLVIDDNRAIHDDFQKILGRRGPAPADMRGTETALFGESDTVFQTEPFSLSLAAQGEEGLRLAQEARWQGEPFAMAFIDVRMPPGWDGIHTTAEIWKADPDIQVVICTAYSDYSWQAMTDELGPSDRLLILKKPFDNIEVAQLAETLSMKWNLARQARGQFRELEALVQERTAELTKSNQELKAEIERRQAMERDRQTLEVQLRQAQKLEAIGQLAAGIAHEINTPTQYVGDNTRFIQDSWTALEKVLRSHQELTEAAKRGSIAPELIASAEQFIKAAELEYLYQEIPPAITATLEGVERVTKIVRAMKEFSHPGGREKTKADLNKAIESTTTVALNEYKYVADLQLDLAPDLPTVPCLLGEFNQSLLNLVVNAAHAIGDVVKQKPGTRGKITIRSRHKSNFVEICVSDTGSGIPDSARPHIFEPFFTTKGVGKGTGQGLAIVYGNIVKKHGGTVTFETEAGQGTTFILRLPLSPP